MAAPKNAEMDKDLLHLPKNTVLCRQGEKNMDLYLLLSGKLMVCVTKGSAVTPLAYLEKGEYFGELSFFDHGPRSANVVTVEDCLLLKIPSSDLGRHFTPWLHSVALTITKRIRTLDEVIRQKGIRRSKVDTIHPLSIEEQRTYFDLLEADKFGRVISGKMYKK